MKTRIWAPGLDGAFIGCCSERLLPPTRRQVEALISKNRARILEKGNWLFSNEPEAGQFAIHYSSGQIFSSQDNLDRG